MQTSNANPTRRHPLIAGGHQEHRQQTNPTRRSLLLGAAASLPLLGLPLLSGCDIPFSPAQASSQSSQPTVARTGSTADAGKKGGLLRLASYPPYSFDPFFLQEMAGIQIASLLFEPLLRYDYRSQTLLPAAAKDWRVLDGGTLFIFWLREDGKFHNGKDVTARDFKFSWERLCRHDVLGITAANAGYLSVIEGADKMLQGEASSISGIKLLGERILQLRLKQPFFDFPQILSFPVFAPVPCHGETRDAEAFRNKPVGNGPFMMQKAWGGGDLINLKRFDGYRPQPAFLKSVEVMLYAGDEKTPFERKTYDEFQNQALDIARLPQQEIQDARMNYGESLDGYSAQPGSQVVTGLQACTEFLWANCKQAPLSDPRVRKAVSYAIDREKLCNMFFENSAVPASGMVPPVIPGARSAAWPAATHDSAEAKKLLFAAIDESAEPLPAITLLLAKGQNEYGLILGEIKRDLESVGFKTELKVVEGGSEYYNILENKPSLTVSGWIADFALMENFLSTLFLSTGLGNSLGYSNLEFDEAIATARAVPNPVLRLAAYHKAENILAEDMPAIPLLYKNLDLVCSDYVNDFYVAPDGIIDLRSTWV
jgi:peptide/nickel transport system substrate-binding protein/oligopeptide transport system substrate-binding protein